MPVSNKQKMLTNTVNISVKQTNNVSVSVKQTIIISVSVKKRTMPMSALNNKHHQCQCKTNKQCK